MRRLVARYAATSLDRLMKNPDFIEFLQREGDFVLDLLMALPSGPKINQYELNGF